MYCGIGAHNNNNINCSNFRIQFAINSLCKQKLLILVESSLHAAPQNHTYQIYFTSKRVSAVKSALYSMLTSLTPPLLARYEYFEALAVVEDIFYNFFLFCFFICLLFLFAINPIKISSLVYSFRKFIIKISKL